MSADELRLSSLLPIDDSLFEQQLTRIVAECRDPAAGVFGPGSWMWEITRHTVVFAGGMGRRVTLQVAHPWVTSAIDQHSRVRDDAGGRARRTYHIVFQIIYGNLSQALKAARTAHHVHSRIEGQIDEGSGAFASGERYRANEAQTMLWIHATMWDTFARVYQQLVRPLSATELEAYYQETRRFAWLFGIPDAVLPADWNAFQSYCQAMLEGDVLAVNPSTRQLADFVMNPPGWLAVLPMIWVKAMTVGMYPVRLRDAYGWRYSRLGVVMARWVGIGMDRCLPSPLRFLPAWHEARARLACRPAGAFTRRLNRWLFRTDSLVG